MMFVTHDRHVHTGLAKQMQQHTIGTSNDQVFVLLAAALRRVLGAVPHCEAYNRLVLIQNLITKKINQTYFVGDNAHVE